jgi:hypothetical protein
VREEGKAMSTTPMHTFAVDLASLGPIYPFVGTEKLLVLIAMVVWVGFHVWQIRFENRTYAAELAKLSTPERLQRVLEDIDENGR